MFELPHRRHAVGKFIETVIAAQGELERDRMVLQEKIDNAVPERGRLEDCMELAMRLLSRSCNLYKKGDYALRKTVLRLAFAEPLR